MGRKANPEPTLHQHVDGRYYVRVHGSNTYLGRDETQARIRRNDIIRARLDARAQAPPVAPGRAEGATVNVLAVAYLQWCETYYRDRVSGEPTTEVDGVIRALQVVVAMYGSTLIADFTARDLEAVRTAMATGDWRETERDDRGSPRPRRPGWCRAEVNKNLGRLKRMFERGAEGPFYLVDADQVARLKTVRNLPRHRSVARETKDVTPVDLADVRKAQSVMTPMMQAMVEIHLLGAMRSQDLVRLRPCDIDRDGSLLAASLDGVRVPLGGCWAYIPGWKEAPKTGRHKNAWREQLRVIPITPPMQAILAPYLLGDPDRPAFSPAVNRAAFDEVRRTARKTPHTPTSRARLEAATRRKQKPLSIGYTPATYCRAVRRAVDVYNGQLERRARQAATAVDPRLRCQHWHPHQLRHTAGTLANQRASLKDAQMLLGHASEESTKRYVAQLVGDAVAVAERLALPAAGASGAA